MTPRYAIILGCPRSGTTFLSRLLNAVPGVESVIGTLLPVGIPHIANHVDDRMRAALAIAFERSLDAYLHSGRCHSRAMALQKWANTRNGLTALLDATRGKREIELMVYKEPMLSFAPRFVLESFPDSKVLNIVRDGRDVANSMVRTYGTFSDEAIRRKENNLYSILGRKHGDAYVPWWVEDGREQEYVDSAAYVRSIWLWNFVTLRCREVFTSDAARPGQVLEIRYEDLMRRPDEVAASIQGHFGYEPGRAYEKFLKTASVGSIGRHDRRDVEEVQAAERVARDGLRMFGYLDS